MVRRGFERVRAKHSAFFICGLILAYGSPFAVVVHASSGQVRCISVDVASKYQHCRIDPDGVRDLDCFSKYTQPASTCVWKPGNYAGAKTYTLIIQQQLRSKMSCKVSSNITEMSAKVRLYEKKVVTAEILENAESANCTKAVFTGSPESLYRCGPPYSVSFWRHSGKLVVNVSWKQEDVKNIEYYSMRYKALGSLEWSKSQVQKNRVNCTVENLNSSLLYSVQIQCVANSKCSQCVWSEAYTVPSELTTPPVIVNLQNSDIAGRKGCRLLTLTWKFSSEEQLDGYHVSLGKASGEAPWEQINATRPEIRLILSYSAYLLNISAVNNASTSPAVSEIIPQREDEHSMGDGKLNVTVHSNTSFTLYWKDNLITKYVCYSAEWMQKGQKAVHMSFFQNENNYWTLSSLPEPLEPYKRYSLSLHTRPYKDTCNIKHNNNSESTYGSTQFYFIEGSPTRAPTNISSCNVTLSSVVLQWSSIPEDDIRGFLLGYIIYYSEYQNKGTGSETNISVDPTLNSYELSDLKSEMVYEVQISGFTRAGAGVRSEASLITTQHKEYFNLSSIITFFAVVFAVLIFGSLILKRAKAVLWPSIPNPGESNAMQKIEAPFELRLLESLNTLKVEEWDRNSLQIVEEEVVLPAGMLPSMLPLLSVSDDEGDSAGLTCDWIQTDSEDATGDIQPDTTQGGFSHTGQTNLQTSTLAFGGGYTTMEMFQQAMPQCAPVSASPTEATAIDPEHTDLTVTRPRLDYVRQFSTSPVSDNIDMSTIL